MIGDNQLEVGSTKYPRIQYWNIKDFFNGKFPNLPPTKTMKILSKESTKENIKQEFLNLQTDN